MSSTLALNWKPLAEKKRFGGGVCWAIGLMSNASSTIGIPVAPGSTLVAPAPIHQSEAVIATRAVRSGPAENISITVSWCQMLWQASFCVRSALGKYGANGITCQPYLGP